MARVMAPHNTLQNRQLTSFGERFRDGQYSLVSFLFAVLLLTVFSVKVGARAAVPYGVGATLLKLLLTSLLLS